MAYIIDLGPETFPELKTRLSHIECLKNADWTFIYLLSPLIQEFHKEKDLKMRRNISTCIEDVWACINTNRTYKICVDKMETKLIHWTAKRLHHVAPHLILLRHFEVAQRKYTPITL